MNEYKNFIRAKKLQNGQLVELLEQKRDTSITYTEL